MSDLDAVLIGAGHNGLTCAAYLGLAGLRVRVLERRGIVGGACVTEEFHPSFRASTAAYTVGLCLGHAFVGVRGVYDRFQYIDEKRAAFEALAQMVDRIVRPPSEPAVADIASHAES